MGKKPQQEIAATRIQKTTEFPTWGSFYFRPDGLCWIDPEKDDAKPIHLCGPLRVRAMVRTVEGEDWGLDLAWSDHDGNPHQWAMPLSLLGGDSAEVRRALMGGGLFVSATRRGREKLSEYLSALAVRVSARARGVHRPGWSGELFLLPPEWTVGGDGTERVLFQSALAGTERFREQGTLEEWKHQVARLAEGNSRLALAIAAAFAGPLLRHLQVGSFGVHFGGPSSTGKSTALFVGGSVWGGGPDGYHITWHTTGCGIEGVALRHNDGLLVLDEIGEVDGKTAGSIAYMLGNGTGKQRAQESGLPRAIHSWRLVYLSSGEMGLAEKMAEAGEHAKAGQGVRLLEIPTDGLRYGVWECLHGFPSAVEFSNHLIASANRYYGTPIRTFLAQVVPRIHDLVPAVHRIREDFVGTYTPAGSDGQVRRVAAHMGLLAAAGELARACGVLPWSEGESIRCAAKCLEAWCSKRGTIGSLEVLEGVRAVLAFLEIHGPSRFEAHWEPSGAGAVRNRAGYRKRAPHGAWEYYLFPSVMQDEVLQGRSSRAVFAELEKLGVLVKPKHGWAEQISISATDKPKLYHLRPWAAQGKVVVP